MGLSSTPARSFFSGEVSITGDLSVGHQFQSLFEQLDIDLEEQVYHFWVFHNSLPKPAVLLILHLNA
jgi:hypothetical protein